MLCVARKCMVARCALRRIVAPVVEEVPWKARGELERRREKRDAERIKLGQTVRPVPHGVAQ